MALDIEQHPTPIPHIDNSKEQKSLIYTPEIRPEEIEAADSVRQRPDFRSAFFDRVHYDLHHYADTSKMYKEFGVATAFGRYDAVILTGSMRHAAHLLSLSAYDANPKRNPEYIPKFINWGSGVIKPNSIIYKTLKDKTLSVAYLRASIATVLRGGQEMTNRLAAAPLESIIQDLSESSFVLQARASIAVNLLFKDKDYGEIRKILREDAGITEDEQLRKATNRVMAAKENTKNAHLTLQLLEEEKDSYRRGPNMYDLKDEVETMLKSNNIDEFDLLEKDFEKDQPSDVEVPHGLPRVSLMQILQPEHMLALRRQGTDPKRTYILDNFIESGKKLQAYEEFFRAWSDSPITYHEIMYIQESQVQVKDHERTYTIQKTNRGGTQGYEILIDGKQVATAYGKAHFVDPDDPYFQGRGHDRHIDPPNVFQSENQVPEAIWRLAVDREFLDLSRIYTLVNNHVNRDIDRGDKIEGGIAKALDLLDQAETPISFARNYTQYDEAHYGDYEQSVHITKEEKELWERGYNEMMQIIHDNPIVQSEESTSPQEPKRIILQTEDQYLYLVYSALIRKLRKQFPELKNAYATSVESSFYLGSSTVYKISKDAPSPDAQSDFIGKGGKVIPMKNPGVKLPIAYNIGMSPSFPPTETIQRLAEETERIRYLLDKVALSSVL